MNSLYSENISHSGGSNKTRLSNPFILVVAGLLLIGGCINGLIATMGVSWQEQGWSGAAGLFGIGFYFPIIVYVAFETIRSADASGITDFQSSVITSFGLLFGSIILLPSSVVSWIAVCLYASILAYIYKSSIRIGAGLFATLAMCAIWTNFGFKAFVAPLTALDAAMTQHIMQTFGFIVERNENILTQASGFSVIILSDCSTWKGLPLEILCFVAICLFGDASLQSPKLWKTTFVVTLMLIVFNIIRLSIISISSDMHSIVHGDVGRSLYDVARVAVVFMAAMMVTK